MAVALTLAMPKVEDTITRGSSDGLRAMLFCPELSSKPKAGANETSCPPDFIRIVVLLMSTDRSCP